MNRKIVLFWLLTFLFSAGPLAAEKHSGYPLAPPNTTSPYHTLESFNQITEQANRELALVYDSPLGEGYATARQETIIGLFEKAALCLDLSEVPEAGRSRVAVESVLLLKEILTRLPPFDLSSVPSAATSTSAWRVPNTSLTIIRAADGRYLFSAATIKRLRQDYETVKSLAASDAGHIDYYHRYAMSAGRLIPPFWNYWVQQLPEFFHVNLAEQAIWQWLGWLIMTAGLVWLIVVSSKALSSKTLAGKLGLPIVVALLIQGYIYCLDYQINLSGQFMQLIRFVSELIVWPIVALFAYQLGSRLSLLFIPSNNAGQILKKSLLRILGTFFGIALATVVMGYGLSRFGVPVYGIVTGLSLGGMAIALAIRPTMENLIGGVILYLDKTVQIGDFCSIGTHSGVIEAIGVRSTRIRAKDRTQVIIANGDLVKMKVVNFSRRDKYQVKFRLGLAIDTPKAVLQLILSETRQLLKDDVDIYPEPQRAYFVEVTEVAQQIEIDVYIDTTDREIFLAKQEQLLVAVGAVIRKHNGQLAYPYRKLVSAEKVEEASVCQSFLS